jgi:hypothetical protein
MYLPKAEKNSPIASTKRNHFQSFGIRDADLKKIDVNSVSVATLLNRYGFKQVDVLQLDTEGLDLKILNQFFTLGLEPYIINLEVFHLTKRERELLRDTLTARCYQFQEYNMDLLAIHANLLN